VILGLTGLRQVTCLNKNGFCKLKADVWLVEIANVKSGLNYNVRHVCDR
jgi:hypothetical protein